MAVNRVSSRIFFGLVLICWVSHAQLSSAKLQLGYYQHSCPRVEDLIRDITFKYVTRLPTVAPALLRMNFHDCFVRGCDGSLLLRSTNGTNQAEEDAFPNLSLRRGFPLIDIVKAAVEKKCAGVVSCADILALVARDAVSAIHGPFWNVPLGRRDGRVSSIQEALAQLPSPAANITQLKSEFASKGLSVKDLVVLSGGHTIGFSQCISFSRRLYNFTGKGDADPSLDSEYGDRLKRKCSPADITKRVEMDPGSLKTFDDSYYSLVAKRRGLFNSDSALLDDKETKAYVLKHGAHSHGLTFGDDFATSMEKMGKIQVLTGKRGEIRKQCGFVN